VSASPSTLDAADIEPIGSHFGVVLNDTQLCMTGVSISPGQTPFTVIPRSAPGSGGLLSNVAGTRKPILS